MVASERLTQTAAPRLESHVSMWPLVFAAPENRAPQACVVGGEEKAGDI